MKESKLILIIEDNKSFRLLMTHFFSKHYQVVTKNDGISAMHWLKEGYYPDLILLDLGMPKMTGKDFLTGLKSSGFYKNIPVIVVSGNKRDTFTNDAMNDIQHYFEKPFDPRKLLEKIEHIFTSSPVQYWFYTPPKSLYSN